MLSMSLMILVSSDTIGKVSTRHGGGEWAVLCSLRRPSAQSMECWGHRWASAVASDRERHVVLVSCGQLAFFLINLSPSTVHRPSWAVVCPPSSWSTVASSSTTRFAIKSNTFGCKLCPRIVSPSPMAAPPARLSCLHNFPDFTSFIHLPKLSFAFVWNICIKFVFFN